MSPDEAQLGSATASAVLEVARPDDVEASRGRRAPAAGLPITAAVLSIASSVILLLVLDVLLPARKSIWTALMDWDGNWYQGIAAHGYSWNPASTRGQNVVFLPLFPLLERAGHLLTGLSIQDVGVGSSILLQAAAAAVLVRIAQSGGSTDRQSLLWAVLYLVSPPAVFDIMGYYSALFCLLCFLGIRFVQLGRPWRAAVAFGLASATNPLGLAAAGGFVIWRLIHLDRPVHPDRFGRTLALACGQALVSVSGILAYALYLGIRFGDPLAFYQANKGWVPTLPLATVVARVASFETVHWSVTEWVVSPTPAATSFMMDAVVTLLIVALIVALGVSKGGLRTLEFWFMVLALLLVQVQSARWGRELSTTRLLVPLAFGATAGVRLSRVFARPVVFFVTLVVLCAGTAVFLQHLAAGQWID